MIFLWEFNCYWSFIIQSFIADFKYRLFFGGCFSYQQLPALLTHHVSSSFSAISSKATGNFKIQIMAVTGKLTSKFTSIFWVWTRARATLLWRNTWTTEKGSIPQNEVPCLRRKIPLCITAPQSLVVQGKGEPEDASCHIGVNSKSSLTSTRGT